MNHLQDSYFINVTLEIISIFQAFPWLLKLHYNYDFYYMGDTNWQWQIMRDGYERSKISQNTWKDKAKSLSLLRIWNRGSEWLYVLVMSRTRLRVNAHSIVVWMSRNFLLEACAKSQSYVTATGIVLESLSSQTNSQPFGQTNQMIELCSDYLSVRCIWLYVLVMSRTRFQSESTLSSCFNVKELLARGMPKRQGWVSASGLKARTT